MIEVYYAPPSIYGRKVLVALEEKGLDYEIKKMNFGAKDHKTENYLKLNPNGEIPTLVDDSFVVYESTAIIEYLNDEYPEPPLMPEDSSGRASVRMVEDFCDLHLYPQIVRCLYKIKVKQETIEDADKAELTTLMKRIQDYLGTQAYVAGANFSLADCAVMVAIASLEGLELGSVIPTSAAMKKYADGLKKRASYKAANLFSFETVAAC